MSAWSRRARNVRMRASSMPCSFFAAWYSKFSERSPNSRAFLIAATTSCLRGPSSSSTSARRAAACLTVSFSEVDSFITGFLPLRAPSTPRGVEELRARELHAGRLELVRPAVEARDAADVRLLLGQDERDARAAATRAAGPTDAVGVHRRVLRRVEVDD